MSGTLAVKTSFWVCVIPHFKSQYILVQNREYSAEKSRLAAGFCVPSVSLRYSFPHTKSVQKKNAHPDLYSILWVGLHHGQNGASEAHTMWKEKTHSENSIWSTKAKTSIQRMTHFMLGWLWQHYKWSHENQRTEYNRWYSSVFSSTDISILQVTKEKEKEWEHADWQKHKNNKKNTK